MLQVPTPLVSRTINLDALRERGRLELFAARKGRDGQRGVSDVILHDQRAEEHWHLIVEHAGPEWTRTQSCVVVIQSSAAERARNTRDRETRAIRSSSQRCPAR